MRTEMQRGMTVYGLPVLIGLGGILYAQQLPPQLLRVTVTLVSVALPLWASGSLLSRYQTSYLERLLMLIGVLLLLLSVSYNISGDFSQSMTRGPVLVLARILGMLSLFLGLFVVLFFVIRPGAGAEEMADRFRFLAEHISEGFIVSQPDGKIVLANQQALDMFEMKREDTIGQNIRQIASTLGLNVVIRHLDDRADGIISEYEIVWQTPNNYRVLLIGGTPLFNKRGKHMLTLATVRDITEQRQMTQRAREHTESLQKQVEEQTQKLRQSEDWLRHLLFSMNEGFLTVDAQYRILLVNDKAASLLKTDRDNLRGRDIFEYVNTVGRTRLQNLFMHAMQATGSKGRREEVEFLDVEGNQFPALAGVVYLNDPKHDNEGYSLALTPIADFKQMQQKLLFHTRQLERANEELRSHDRAKDSFLSNVTHELRTPLTTIRGYIEMFLENNIGEITDAQRHALMVMDRNSKHLLNNINEMIEFSRMQIKGIHLLMNLYDATALGREAVAAFLPAATEKKIKMLENSPSYPLLGWGDRDKLLQVLGILLNNAVKFTEPEGVITLSIACEKDSDIIFSVKDTGIGIDPVNQAKIFERFFQVDRSKTRKYEGSGIGLSIAKTIIEAHEGSIKVNSIPDHGSTFIVHLPNSIFVKDVDTDTAAGLKALRILIVEESEERRDALRSFSPLDSCPVHFVPNGYQAARHLSGEKPDMIIINDAPADVAGEISLRFLRQYPGTMEVPAIVLTGERSDVLQRTLESGTNVRFLYKPFKADVLVQLMERIVTSGITIAENIFEEYLHPPTDKPLALIIDADPGFLEWVDTALKYDDIDACCISSPERILEFNEFTRSPDAIFIDSDMSTRQLEELLTSLRSCAATSDKAVYLLTGMTTKYTKTHEIQCAGTLHKPFPISDMTAIVLSAKKYRNTKGNTVVP